MKNATWITLFAALMLTCRIPEARAQEESVDPYLGTWALTIEFSEASAGWLEVRQENGYLDAEMLWSSGSVFPVDHTFVMDGELYLVQSADEVRERDEAGDPVRVLRPVSWYQVFKSEEEGLEGYHITPNRNGMGVKLVTFTGKKVSPPGPPPNQARIRYGEPVTLFNGRDLQGWELVHPYKTSGWKVVDGIMVNDPVQREGQAHIVYGNLRTTATFEDFNLKLEVNIPEGSNSGIYLRGIYEIQVVDSYGHELDPHNMGALYSRITPLLAAEKPAGQWQSMDITLCRRYLTVVLNGKTIIDNQPVKGVTGEALTSDESLPGPIMLQGDHGKVSYRNMVLRPILQ